MPPKRSLLECAWPVAQDVYGELVPPERADPGTATRAPTVLRSLAADWQMPVTPLSAAWTAPPDASSVDEEIEFSWARETARHVGTVVHRWLQRMAQDALQGWTPARVEDLRAHFAQELKRRGVQPSECAAAAGVVAEALTRTLADDRGRWLLGPHPEAASEYRLRAWRNGMLSTHIIDRLIRDADGTRWVVDFKTSRHEGADVEAFLDRERERYTGQLRRYLGVVGEARAGLYFPLLQGWRALD